MRDIPELPNIIVASPAPPPGLAASPVAPPPPPGAQDLAKVVEESLKVNLQKELPACFHAVKDDLERSLEKVLKGRLDGMVQELKKCVRDCSRDRLVRDGSDLRKPSKTPSDSGLGSGTDDDPVKKFSLPGQESADDMPLWPSDALETEGAMKPASTLPNAMGARISRRKQSNKTEHGPKPHQRVVEALINATPLRRSAASTVDRQSSGKKCSLGNATVLAEQGEVGPKKLSVFLENDAKRHRTSVGTALVEQGLPPEGAGKNKDPPRSASMRRPSAESSSTSSSSTRQEPPQSATAKHPLWDGMLDSGGMLDTSDKASDLRNSRTSNNFLPVVSLSIDMEEGPPGLWDEVRQFLQWLVCTEGFCNFIAFCIAVNAIMLGLRTDYAMTHIGEKVPSQFDIFENFCTCIFAVELLLRMLGFGMDFWTDIDEWVWNWFDFLVILAQIVDDVAASTSGWEGVPGTFNLWRVMQIPKMVRIASVLRLARFFQDLRAMIHSIMNAFRSLAATVVLMLIIMYTVSVWLTSLVAAQAAETPRILETDRGVGDFYGSMWRSMLTVFQAITGGLDWNDMTTPLMKDISPWLAIPMVAYIAITMLAVLNVITGIFVETALTAARSSKDTELRNKMARLFMRMDINESGKLSWEDFAGMLEDPDMMRCFRLLDIDLCEARGLFTLLDTDMSGEIDADEFVLGCLRLQGAAKAIDLATLMYFNKRISTWWQDQMASTKRRLSYLTVKLEEIQDSLNEMREQKDGVKGLFGAQLLGTGCSSRRVSKLSGAPEGNGDDAGEEEGDTTQSLANFATWSSLKGAGNQADVGASNGRRPSVMNMAPGGAGLRRDRRASTIATFKSVLPSALALARASGGFPETELSARISVPGEGSASTCLASPAPG